MKNKVYKYAFAFSILSIIIPSVAFAAWWNPLTWHIFSWLALKPAKTISLSATTSVQNIPITTVQTSVIVSTTSKTVSPTKQIQQIKAIVPVSNPTPVATTLPLVVSCSADTTNIAPGQSVIWTARASGGNGTYSYTWVGDDGLSGTSQSPTISWSYNTTGIMNARVSLTSGSQTANVSCTNAVIVTQTESVIPTTDYPTPSNSMCSEEIQQIQQQILQMRQKASGEEEGDLTTGTSAVGQGNANLVAQQESQQEYPLQIQLQQLELTCSN